LLVEVICAGGLAALSFNFRTLISVIIGCVLAVLMAAAAAAVVSMWVHDNAATKPTKQLQRITRALVGFGGLWLVACASALAILRTQHSSAGALLFWAIMTLLTLVSPICSSLCGHAADLLFWSRQLCRELRSIRSVSRDLDLLGACCERTIRPGPGAGPEPTPVSRVLKVSGAVALVTAILCGAPTMCRAAALPVYIYADLSPSARAADVTQVLNDLAQRLSNYEGGDALVISVTPFYENGFMAAPFVEVKIPGKSPYACPLPVTEVAGISKGFATARTQQCEELRAEADREATRRRSLEIAKLTAAIDNLSALRLPGHCTAVNAIVRRAGRERPNGVSIVVSDMENSCASRDLPRDLQAENQTFVIPVGSRGHPIEEGFDGIQARFARTMPWVQVIELYRLEVVMNSIAHPEPRISARH
jgi:hypothetical protein